MSNLTSYLLRDVPKDFWGEVRNLAYQEGISIRDLIIGELENAINREKSGEETDKAPKGKGHKT